MQNNYLSNTVPKYRKIRLLDVNRFVARHCCVGGLLTIGFPLRVPFDILLAPHREPLRGYADTEKRSPCFVRTPCIIQ